MGILSRTFAVVLLFMGLSSAQWLSLLLFLIPEKTVDEKFMDVEPPEESYTDAQIMEMPPVNLAYDSTSIYKKLIVEEDEKAHASVVPVILLGGMDALWALCFFAALTGEEEEPDNAGEAIAKSFSVPLLYLMGVGGLVVTTPFLVYYSYKFASRGWHRHKRDEYYRSYDAYVKRRSRAQSGQSLAQVFVAPTLDFANGGAGLNLLVMF